MLNWGIAGTGRIARKFAETVYRMEDTVNVYGVASRNYGKAYKFAKGSHVTKAYESYEKMLKDPAIDAVYIAVPHPMHCEYAVAAMKAGKHVLCEKPVGMNAGQIQHMIDMAYDHNVFFMENMVTRFLPAIGQVRQWIDEGAIGEVRFVDCFYGFPAQGFPDSRWFNRELGGGALLDIGIYPITLATMILGFDIEDIKTQAYIGEAQTDEHESIIFVYRGGRRIAHLSASVVSDLGCGAVISGEYGKIILDHFTKCEKVVLEKNFEAPLTVKFPHDVNGFEYVIREAESCIRRGDLESSRLPWVVTLENMRIMDRIRGMWGLRYPCE
ncbi:putative dehydrogenase [Catenibacillus scindens]|uniref:Putative dehydrogenase n=1 Tax=Catenibacillus scindens TaxID=673271 RepID=A0A7W8M615_9FIRM|nr:Gfo/Idh/MocA family oxidoreductase [Catenibacillus scindens]MBB5265132.1 putative dehydrogenase [Catenibacillus scindens]